VILFVYFVLYSNFFSTSKHLQISSLRRQRIMCWNWEVSICFSIAIALGSVFIYKRRSLGFKGTERDSYEALLVSNLAFVQFWEFLIWLFVYPRDADPTLCPKANIVFTAMVYFHGVLLWPPIVNTLAYKTTKGKREYFAFPLFYGCIYTVLGIFDLLYTQFYLKTGFTCGLDGKTFLQWSVALSQSRILPNGYDWFLFTAFPFIFYKPRPLGIFMVFYLVATFAIPYLLVTLGEAASIFCWLGVGIFIVFQAEPHIIHFFETRYPTLLTYDPISTMLIKVGLKEDKSIMKKERILTPAVSHSEGDLELSVRESNESNATVLTAMEDIEEGN